MLHSNPRPIPGSFRDLNALLNMIFKRVAMATLLSCTASAAGLGIGSPFELVGLGQFTRINNAAGFSVYYKPIRDVCRSCLLGLPRAHLRLDSSHAAIYLYCLNYFHGLSY